MSNRGKRIYRTSMLGVFRLVLLALILFFFNDFYLSTFQEPKFLAQGNLDFWAVCRFHWRYPTEFFSLAGLVLVPAFYYAFIRGVRFFEKGYLFNRGLPFFNTWVPYEDVKQYKLLLPNAILAVFTKSGDIHMVADGDIERVIALLDQHGVPGNLAQDEYVRLIKNMRKFVFVVLAFTALLYVVKKFGWLKVIP